MCVFAIEATKVYKQMRADNTCSEQEDLKVLRRSPDLFNNVKIGQGQLLLIITHILFYHIWGCSHFGQVT